eukprot:CAMPEP_0195596254 /NCGR_PEP_ID=MMETSP0815-20121206/2361_1 /TAXON_ID=97485 /ORGANISM="Prymnesium parvum, Strain Texoma1" /LENGTH=83 /DNA_ID=CAMNT_0040735531 /DNA_START=929 /DNA_END=1176 /DNA_ORIENTATION=-
MKRDVASDDNEVGLEAVIRCEARRALLDQRRAARRFSEPKVAIEDAREARSSAPRACELEEQVVSKGGAAALGDVREDDRVAA